MSCEIAVRRASDSLARLLAADERADLHEHLATCDRCAYLMDQLRRTLAILRNRPGLVVPDVLRELVGDAADPRGAEIVRHLPQLYSLAVALDPRAADDLVQETISRTLADPAADTSDASLAAALTHLTQRRQPVEDGPFANPPGDDPDADEAELFYPHFYGDAPDPGRWIDAALVWGETRVLTPDADVLTAETYEVVDAAVASLDPPARSLLTLVDIDGVPFGQAVMILDLERQEARERLANARLAVRTALDRYLRS